MPPRRTTPKEQRTMVKQDEEEMCECAWPIWPQQFITCGRCHTWKHRFSSRNLFWKSRNIRSESSEFSLASRFREIYSNLQMVNGKNFQLKTNLEPWSWSDSSTSNQSAKHRTAFALCKGFFSCFIAQSPCVSVFLDALVTTATT